jgi:hypothetical protein
MAKAKTPEKIRIMLNIKNDLTPQEEVQLRKADEWCEK